MLTSRALTRLSFTVFLFSLACLTAHGQVTTVNDTTSTPIEGSGHNYIKALNETVNPANGSVSLRIQVPMPPGRGITVPFAIAYDSNGVNHLVPALSSSPSYGGGSGAFASWASNNDSFAQGGWSYVYPSLRLNNWTQNNEVVTGVNDGNPVYTDYACSEASNYLFLDGSGGSHSLGLGYQLPPSQPPTGGWTGCHDYPGANPSGGDSQVTAILNNGSSTMLPVTVQDQNGTVYYFATLPGGVSTSSMNSGVPTYIEDRNGNRVTTAQNGNTSFSFTDSLDRTAISVNGFGPSGTTNTVYAGGLAYQVTWKTVSVNYAVPSTAVYNLANECSWASSVQVSYVVVSQIILPDGQSYRFYYSDNPNQAFQNPYGLLSEVDYPSGAWVKYTWKLSDNYNEAAAYPAPSSTGPVLDGCVYHYQTPVVASRQVGFGGSSNPALTQTFVYQTNWDSTILSLWDSKTTQLTTTDNIRGVSALTSYTYSPYTEMIQPFANTQVPAEVPVEQTIKYYDWGNASTPIRTVYKNWADTFELICETDTLDTGQTSGHAYAYNYGQIAEQQDFDFGQIAAGSCPNSGWSRRTHSNFQSFTGPSAVAAGLAFGRPTSTITYDGGGNTVAESDYAYDETGVSSLPGTTQHDDTNYGTGFNTRGNLTTKTQRCFVGATNCTNSSVTKHTYDQTGQVTSTTDPCGNANCSDMPLSSNHTSTYSYADSYTVLSGGQNVSYNAGTTTNAYLTKITDPLGHTQNFTYDFNTGELTLSKDPNGLTTTYLYNDPLTRPTLATFPDGGKTTLTYNDTPPNPTVTTSRYFTSSQAVTTTTTMDGMGHVIESLVTPDPDCSSGDQTDTAYDGLGRAFGVSNPFCTNADPNYGGTTYIYDALGRTTRVVLPGGGYYVDSISTSYSGNATTVTDQAGKERRSYTDGLGRLIEVDEPSGTGTPAYPGTGSATVGGAERSLSGTPGSTTVTITGSEKSVVKDPCAPCEPMGCPACPTTTYDSGYVTLRVNGFTAQAGYGSSGDNTSTVASSLATALNNSSSPVVASASGSAVRITAKATGTSTNYSFTTTSVNSDPTDFSSGSFAITPTSGSLSGGSSSGTTYDTGTVSVNVNGFVASASYGQSSTPSSIATALTTALGTASAPVSQSPVNASASGATITLTSKAAGSTTNYSLSMSSASAAGFSPVSFSTSVSGSTLTGGVDGNPLAGTPNITRYAYDVLDNLVCAVQKGQDSSSFIPLPGTATPCGSTPPPAAWRARSFIYDSLSRLTQSNNPESGIINYSYDANGNLSTKVSPLPNQALTGNTVAATYSYEPLNRLTQKSFSDGTPTEQYAYDGNAIPGCTPPSLSSGYGYAIGKRTAMCDAAGAEAWGYTITSGTGWKTQDARNTKGVTFTTTAQNNLGGMLYTLTYPSGHVLTYTPNGVGRLLSASDSTGGISYASAASYWPTGSLATVTNGSNLYSTYIFNPRLQPCWIYANIGAALTWKGTTCTASATTGSILDLKYNFNLGVADNGNVVGITNNRDVNRSQTYTYDALDRLTNGQTTSTYSTSTTRCWGEAFGYDAYGNLLARTVASSSYTGCAQESTLNVAATTNNQIQSTAQCFDANGNLLTTGMSTYCYDAAGNMMTDTTGASHYYDAENHLKSLPTLGFSYLYDGDGRRVAKLNSSGAATKIYWYGTGSDALDETDGTGATNNAAFNEYAFFGGKRIARRNYQNNVYYYVADHLGTARATVQAGQTTACYDADFYPFGGERTITDTCDSAYKFTGKERDTESGLDNFGKRYFGSSLGRFQTPDAFYKDSHVGDPQSWNEYAYARNNPLRYVDPTGQNATVSSSCSTDANNHTTCNVNISASIAIYAAPGSGLTQEQLNGAATTIQNSIQNAWSGSFSQDGVTYNVSTQVSVQVAASEGDASKTGAQNVIGLSNGPADAAHNANALTGPSNSLGTFLRGQDTGTWNYNTLGADSLNTAAHEFTHLLGVDDHTGNVLSNTDPTLAAPHATAADLGWGIREATKSVGLGLSMKSWYNGPALPTPFTFSTRDNVGAPSFGWWK